VTTDKSENMYSEGGLYIAQDYSSVFQG